MTFPFALLACLLIAHALCDYPLQADWLSKAKRPGYKLTDRGLEPAFLREGETIWPLALASHAAIHAGAVALFTQSWWLAAFEFFAHAWIDYGKCRGLFGYNTDQVAHIACKVLWVVMLSFGWV